MSIENVQAERFTCDNPTCGVGRVSDSGIPVGWFTVYFNGATHFCSRDCVDRRVASTRVEQQDTHGIIATGLVK